MPHQSSDRGRLLALPAPVDFRAPAALCEPIDGQPYDQVPTERAGTTPAWKVEEKVYFGPERGPARIVHRGDCRPRPRPPGALWQHRAVPKDGILRASGGGPVLIGGRYVPENPLRANGGCPLRGIAGLFLQAIPFVMPYRSARYGITRSVGDG